MLRGGEKLDEEVLREQIFGHSEGPRFYGVWMIWMSFERFIGDCLVFFEGDLGEKKSKDSLESLRRVH